MLPDCDEENRRSETKRLELKVAMDRDGKGVYDLFALHADKFLMPKNGIDDVDG